MSAIEGLKITSLLWQVPGRSEERWTSLMVALSEHPRVRAYLGCSLDGCIAGPDHDIFMAQVGAMLMGRATVSPGAPTGSSPLPGPMDTWCS